MSRPWRITRTLLALKLLSSLEVAESASRVSRVACQSGLCRLAEFELAGTGVCGVACGVRLLVLGYSISPHYNYFQHFTIMKLPSPLPSSWLYPYPPDQRRRRH